MVPTERPAPRRSSLPTAALAGAIALALLAVCCSRLPIVGKRIKKQQTLSKEPLEMGLGLTQNSLRPGEPLIAYAWVRNAGSKPYTIRMLDASSVEFYLRKPGTDPTVVHPVVSSKEPLNQTETVAPGQSVPKGQSRAFVFTAATADPGEFQLLAVYHPTDRLPPQPDLSSVVAKAVSFKVAGQRAFNRDRDGILLKEDATALAQRYLARPVSNPEAFLLEDEMGFLIWKIVLTVDPATLKPGEAARRAIFINPYRGIVVQDSAVQQPPTAAKPPAATKPVKPPALGPAIPPAPEPTTEPAAVAPTLPPAAAAPTIPPPGSAPTTGTLPVPARPKILPSPK